MEIKDKLNKPYTEKQRLDFIVKNNHKLGYEIQETNEALLAVYNEPPVPTKDDIKRLREQAYIKDVDPITCHINRLKDEEQTEEIVARITELKELREHKVQEIKEKYPYSEDEESGE